MVVEDSTSVSVQSTDNDFDGVGVGREVSAPPLDSDLSSPVITEGDTNLVLRVLSIIVVITLVSTNLFKLIDMSPAKALEPISSMTKLLVGMMIPGLVTNCKLDVAPALLYSMI